MHIERKRSSDPDGQIQAGPLYGRYRFYRDALYSTLVHLQPKVCLEIGTYTGQSSAIFQQYFNEYCPDGILVTCDINRYNNSLQELPNVRPVLVYPHIANSTEHHYVQKERMLPDADYPTKIADSIRCNAEIILGAIGNPKSSEAFDFCFLDGDHNEQSVLNDFAIANMVLKSPKHILFDDTDEWNHYSAKYYHEQLKVNPQVKTYEFADWSVIVGAALIWQRDGVVLPRQDSYQITGKK